MEALQESLGQMNQMFLLKLAEFEERQQKLTSVSTSTDSNLVDDFHAFKSFTLNALRVLQLQVEALSQGHDNLEMHSRRKILLLHGCPEDKKENTSSIVAKVVNEKFKLASFTTSDISRCHRMGKSSDPAKPRPILFKLRNIAIRGNIWAAKAKLKGTGITVSEFLTKARHDAFMAARQRFGVTRSWTRDGSVFVLAENGERHRVNSVADLSKVDVKQVPSVVIAKQTVAAAKETKNKRAAATKK